MFSVVEGNLFDSQETYLCHQTNCVTNRSAHLAADVFSRYLYADIYTNRKTPDEPGSIIVRGNSEDKRLVINMLGQYYPGSPRYPNGLYDGHQVRLRYFWECLKAMSGLYGDFAFPWMMGCGAGGGDWNRYLAGLKWFEQQIEGNVVVYKLPENSPL